MSLVLGRLWASPSIKAASVFFALVFFMILLAWMLSPVLIAVLLSFTLYILLEPVNSALTRLGLPRAVAAFLLILGVSGIFSLLILLVFPGLSDQLLSVQDRIGLIRETLIGSLEGMLGQLGLKANLKNMLVFLTDEGPSFDLDALIKGSNVMLEISATLLLVPFISFFLLRDFKSLRNRVLNLLANKYFEMGWLIYYRAADQLQGYLRGILIQISILAMIASTGFYLAGFESPIILGVIAGILGLIPYLGPLLALVPPALIALGQTPFDPYMLVAAGTVIGIAYLIDNLLVVPTVIANAVNLHPLIVILGVIIFGNWLGIMGMILAIPIIAACKILYLGLYRGIAKQSQL